MENKVSHTVAYAGVLLGVMFAAIGFVAFVSFASKAHAQTIYDYGYDEYGNAIDGYNYDYNYGYGRSQPDDTYLDRWQHEQRIKQIYREELRRHRQEMEFERQQRSLRCTPPIGSSQQTRDLYASRYGC